jgi:hypothetical protein
MEESADVSNDVIKIIMSKTPYSSAFDAKKIDLTASCFPNN